MVNYSMLKPSAFQATRFWLPVFDHQEDKLVDQLHKLNPEKRRKIDPAYSPAKNFFGSRIPEPFPSVQRPGIPGTSCGMNMPN